jgi:molecular chaperone DnaK
MAATAAGGSGGGPQQRRRRRTGGGSTTSKTPRRQPTPPPPPADDNDDLVVGIDLGTTNSAVARIDPRTGLARCVPNADGDTLTPSVVAFLPPSSDDGDGQTPPLVGRAARRQAPSNPRNTYSSVKRLIGRKRDDPAVEEEARRLAGRGGGGGGSNSSGGGRIVADSEGAAVFLCDHTPTGTLYPEEVSALVLARLLEDAEREDAELRAAAQQEQRQQQKRQRGGGGADDDDAQHPPPPRRRITKAVITVPAYFDDAQREATVQAGRLAGLETVRLIREPVAAALAYGVDLQRRAAKRAQRRGGGAAPSAAATTTSSAALDGDDEPDEQTILVFDLGGGTLDVSLLEVGGGTIEVLSTGGDARLGGDDWDAAVVAWLREQIGGGKGQQRRRGEEGAQEEEDEDAALAARLKALAEYAKVQLSDAEAVDLTIPVGGGGVGARGGKAGASSSSSPSSSSPPPTTKTVRLTRAKLDELSAPLFRRARLPLDAACWQAGIDLNEAVAEAERRRAALAKKGAPAWKRQMVRPDVRPRVGSRAPVSRVLLVGGATRMPSVAAFVRNMTGLEEACIVGGSGGARTLAAPGRRRGGKGGGGEGGEDDTAASPPPQLVDPDEAVALGAAVQAGVLQGEVGDVMVLDQWQASLMRAAAQLALQQQQGQGGGGGGGGGGEGDGEQQQEDKVAALRARLAREYDMSEAPAELRSALRIEEEEEEEDDEYMWSMSLEDLQKVADGDEEEEEEDEVEGDDADSEGR